MVFLMEHKSNKKIGLLKNFLIFAPANAQKRGCGVIGSRARLRIWCREAWGFESLQPHKLLLTR